MFDIAYGIVAVLVFVWGTRWIGTRADDWQANIRLQLQDYAKSNGSASEYMINSSAIHYRNRMRQAFVLLTLMSLAWPLSPIPLLLARAWNSGKAQAVTQRQRLKELEEFKRQQDALIAEIKQKENWK